MLTKVHSRNQTTSLDEIIQYTDPSVHDLQPLQVKNNEWLRRKAPENQLHKWQFTDLFDRLFASLDAAGGIGLSANQIGFPCRAFVMATNRRKVKVYEPRILEVSDIEDGMNEGCLSLDGIQAKNQTFRPTSIVVEYFNGEEFLREGLVGIEARVFQHEYDHLNGFVFTDHQFIKRNLRKQMLLTAGEFHPTFVSFESAVGQYVSKNYLPNVEVDPDEQEVYIDPASDALRTTLGNFRQRLLSLIEDRLIKTIEAW